MTGGNHEILEAIQELATHVDRKVESEIGILRGEMGVLSGELKSDLKTHIDEKLSDLRGDLVVLMRKEDKKMERVVQKLHEKHIFDDRDVRDILSMEPFPRTT